MDAVENFWTNVGINLCSDVLFVSLLLGASWALWQWTVLAKARRFFGTRTGGNITIYVSAHHDATTATRTVVTLEEYIAASDLRRQLERRLGETLFGRAAKRIAGLVGFEVTAQASTLAAPSPARGMSHRGRRPEQSRFEPSVPEPVIVALPPGSPAPRMQGAEVLHRERGAFDRL